MPKPCFATDVDGVLFKSSLLEMMAEQCRSTGLFDDAAFSRIDAMRSDWQNINTEAGYQDYLKQLVTVFMAKIAGVEVEAFNREAQSAFEKHGVRRFGFPRQLLERVRDTHYTIAISGSPDFLVRPLLSDLGFDAIYGSQYAVVDGKFTGRATSVGDKAAIIERLVVDGTICCAGSVALGDTIYDAGMLAFAEHPIMFNASRTLADYGQNDHRRWADVNEVKDRVVAHIYDPGFGGYVEQDLETFMQSIGA